MTSWVRPESASSCVGSFRAKPNEGHKLTPYHGPYMGLGKGFNRPVTRTI